MRRLDEQYLQHPFYGSRRIRCGSLAKATSSTASACSD